MSRRKKSIRAAFREAVFERDNYNCRLCGFFSSPGSAAHDLDAHHIVDRHEMSDGGYTLDNGITLCKGGRDSCHYKAETGQVSVEELRAAIAEDL